MKICHRFPAPRWRALSLIAAGCMVLAANAANTPTEAPQSAMEAFAKAHDAVVGLRVGVAQDARSAQTLGVERSGSGVVIGADGLILTIGYLMIEAETIEIITQDNKKLPAKAVGYDVATGFGLVRALLPLRGAAPVAMGSAAALKAGEAMMAVTGAPGDGADSQVAMTQVVSTRPFSGYWEYHIDLAVFTSPPIANHSGAPLFNQRGELVGVGSLFVSDAAGSGRRTPENMFVPVDLLKPILAELQQSGSTLQGRRPWIGLSSSEQGGRVQVLRVNPDSPAQQAGLAPGDLVLAVDGVTVATLEAFYKKLWDRAQPDAEISLTVVQGATLRTVVVKPVDRSSTMRKPAGI